MKDSKILINFQRLDKLNSQNEFVALQMFKVIRKIWDTLICDNSVDTSLKGGRFS